MKTKLLTVGVALVLAVVSASAQDRVTLRIYTASDASGLVDEDTSKRLEAVADMKKRLAKLSSVALVDKDAQLAIEVTSAGWEASGKSAQVIVPVGGAAVVTPSSTTYSPSGHAKLSSGTFSTEFEAGVGPFGRSIGENLARKVEDWLKKNGQALKALRK